MASEPCLCGADDCPRCYPELRFSPIYYPDDAEDYEPDDEDAARQWGGMDDAD